MLSNIPSSIRIIGLVLITIILSGSLIFVFSKINRPKTPLVQEPKEVPLTLPITDEPTVNLSVPKSNSERDDRILSLEASVAALSKKVDVLLKQQSVTNPTFVSQSLTASAAPTSQSDTPKSIYIPIGVGGSGTSISDFSSASGQEITIDTGNYQGYKQAVFEANLRIYQGNGTAYARLFNKTDGLAIIPSQVSTTSENFTTVTSAPFSLTAGSKTYTVQVKSSTGYSVDLQLTRIRIDF